MILSAQLANEFQIKIVTTGVRGLGLAKKSLSDLILLDVMMPEMNGFETCRRFKVESSLQRNPDNFHHCHDELDAESTGLSLGAAEYINKPINTGIAKHRIRNLFEREILRKNVETYNKHLKELIQIYTSAISVIHDAIIYNKPRRIYFVLE
ncbi:hypothetical protein CCP3SC1_30054 [Gammaproteobacteria bacterium]